jgi:hypothetical protein
MRSYLPPHAQTPLGKLSWYYTRTNHSAKGYTDRQGYREVTQRKKKKKTTEATPAVPNMRQENPKQDPKGKRHTAGPLLIYTSLPSNCAFKELLSLLNVLYLQVSTS